MLIAFPNSSGNVLSMVFRAFQKIEPLSFIGDFTHLIFPNMCLSCAAELTRNELHLCSFCTTNLTPTSFHLFKEPTKMDQLFWGRTPIHSTYAHLFFEKKKTVQHVLFNLKYNNKPQLGLYFGKVMGDTLNDLDAFRSIDAVIPVPLHPKKQFIRGYNQSEQIAKGICQTFPAPLDTKTVVRTRHSETQTKKSRFQRWDNVHKIFRVHDRISQYSHVMLVDDVITTGSTIESIAQALRTKNPSLSISVVTLAIA